MGGPQSLTLNLLCMWMLSFRFLNAESESGLYIIYILYITQENQNNPLKSNDF